MSVLFRAEIMKIAGCSQGQMEHCVNGKSPFLFFHLISISNSQAGAIDFLTVLTYPGHELKNWIITLQCKKTKKNIETG